MEYLLGRVKVRGRQQVERMDEGLNVERGSVETTRADYGSSLVAAGAVNVLIGIWIMVSPFVIDYGGSGLDLNPVVSGAVLAALGLIRVTGSYTSHVVSGLSALVGIWIIISGAALADTVIGAWNLGVFGAVAVVLPFIAEAAIAEAPRRSRS
ncbi:MAG: SPW repeat protein [Solirubrobacterales bacterium]|nr:SPW repeat protein [Solirubrobacterales bacterium]